MQLLRLLPITYREDPPTMPSAKMLAYMVGVSVLTVLALEHYKTKKA